MKDLTYGYICDRKKLETYEWDNVWIEHAERDDITRILYIGDSISCGTRGVATGISNGKAYFDGFGTSKSVDNPYFCDSVRIFAAQQGYRSAVLFNNGLHGWHLDDETEYPEHYDKIVRFLISEFTDMPVFLILTTHVADPERDKRVVNRNEAVKKIADRYSLPLIDFYTPASEQTELISGDGVHFTAEGYRVLAETALQALRNVL